MASVGGVYTAEDGTKAMAALADVIKAMYPKRVLPKDLTTVLILGWAFVGAYVWDKLQWPEWTLINPWFGQTHWYVHAGELIYNIISGFLFGAALFGFVVHFVCRTIEKTQPKKGPPGRPIGADYDWPRPWRVTLTPDAYVSDDGTVKLIVQWPGVDALYPCDQWWAFILYSRQDFLDRCAFADEAEERAFIAEALSHMSEEARARSVDAVKFAAKAIT